VALTKITGQVINDTTGLVVGVTTVGGGISATDGFFSGIVTAVGDASFSGNVSVGGTLTYEDVTNIDAVGLVTARNGIVVGSGITLSKDGDVFFTGIATGNGSGLTNLTAGNLTGALPAISGANLTGIAATDNVRTGILDVAGVGTFRGDVNIPDKIIHLGDTNTAIRFPAADTITAETGGTERLRIASDGLITQKTGDLIIDQTNNGYGGLRIVDSSAGEYSVSYILGRNSGLSAHIFKYNGRTQNQSPWSNNGTGNEMGRWTAAGIAFGGDTAAANSLNDYEEGTFNPTMANSITLHSGSDTLSYVKVGQLVHVTGVLRINSGNSSSDISITNMPFATVNSAESSGNAIGAVSLYDLNMNSGYSQVLCVMNPNSTQLNVVLQTQSGSQQLGLDASDNGYFGVSITYKSA